MIFFFSLGIIYLKIIFTRVVGLYNYSNVTMTREIYLNKIPLGITYPILKIRLNLFSRMKHDPLYKIVISNTLGRKNRIK